MGRKKQPSSTVKEAGREVIAVSNKNKKGFVDESEYIPSSPTDYSNGDGGKKTAAQDKVEDDEPVEAMKLPEKKKPAKKKDKKKAASFDDDEDEEMSIVPTRKEQSLSSKSFKSLSPEDEGDHLDLPKKSKKKDNNNKKKEVDDDEYGISMEVDDKEQKSAPNMFRSLLPEGEDETESSIEVLNLPEKKKSKKKDKKKGANIDDDEYNLGTDLLVKMNKQEDTEIESSSAEVLNFPDKKKGKKGKVKGAQINDDEYEVNSNNKNEDREIDLGGGGVVDASVEALNLPEKKKSKKKGKKKGDDIDDDEYGLSMEAESKGQSGATNAKAEVELEDSFQALNLPEKKKPKKKEKKKGTEIDDDEYGLSTGAEVKEESGSKSSVLKMDAESEVLLVTLNLPEKKKSKKKEKKGGGGEIDDDEYMLPAQTDKSIEDLGASLETLNLSKEKKSKGKNKNDGVKEDVQEKRESNVPPGVLKKAVLMDEAIDGGEEAVESNKAEEVVESAAAKKKKKKKEKEKAAKVASASEAGADSAGGVAQETGKVDAKPAKADAKAKAVPKHVRDLQERLAKAKELEEKRRREEEERQRKEEEEQRRLEELERLKEEAKQRRKEREKEKLLKKRLEGKAVTLKQKEEARRLALMREQFLAQTGASASDVDNPIKETIPAVPKKPKYDNKKRKGPQAVAVVDKVGAVSEEINNDRELQESVIERDKIAKEIVVEDAVEVEASEKKQWEEENREVVDDEEEEEEDWDAKNWEEEISLPALKNSFHEEMDADTSKVAIKSSNNKTPSVSVESTLKTSALPSQEASKLKPQVEEDSEEESEEEDEESEEEESEEEEDKDTKRRREAAMKREARMAQAMAKRSADDLRSPICCILGHVDTGKTKLLDCIRRTNVQEGEAGGITQQIGATYFPRENIKERTKELKADADLRVPGLLVIDTPGHESFTNLRARGSSLCDIAILVVDIMHGLEPQTLESLNLLKMRHTPFVVALNKVDRLYDWKSRRDAPIRMALKQQSKDVVNEFESRLSQVVTQFKEQGLNSELYYKNKELKKYVSIVPTSAVSGEGIADLLLLLVQLCQKRMEDKLMFISEVQCTVLEVKVIEGLGTTIDVILVNGMLHEGDQIVVCGMQGPIVTNIRALLTPHPMKELRVKGTYQHHKELKAAQGIKIVAQGLEHAVAGTQLYVAGTDENDLDLLKEEAMQDMKSVMSRINKSGEGVCVQASTLGSLEALLEFLKSPAVKIPVSGIAIGPVHKKDIIRASVMLERKKKEYATILAFDVKVTPEAKELADELGVKIFMADIIYHLFDQFTAYMNSVKEEKRKESADEAVFPCVLQILPQYIMHKNDPIILGVEVLEGTAHIGTPLCIPSKENIEIGRIASLEVNHKTVEIAKKGQSVAVKIVGATPEETQKMYGRHFDHEDELVSLISRKSIDILKENYREEVTAEEWKLIVKLKKLFNIP